MTDQNSDKVRVPKVAELVANDLRERIMRNELAEGAKLPQESEMVTQYKVSRPTLREAFRILEFEGLISISRGSRAQVNFPGLEIVARHLGTVLQTRGVQLDDVWRARTIIEPPAARLVAARRNPEDVRLLREVIAEEWDTLHEKEPFSHAYTRFHHTLVELAGVKTLGLLINVLNEMIERNVLELYLKTSAPEEIVEAKKRSLHVQEELVDLIEAGDAERAATLWHGFLSKVELAIAERQPDDPSTGMFDRD